MKMPLTLWSGVILSKCLIKDEFIERKTKKHKLIKIASFLSLSSNSFNILLKSVATSFKFKYNKTILNATENIMEIKITDSISIPCGNLGFILEASGHQKLYERCIELERSLKSDYDAFALNYRLVLEEFAMIEEVNRRIIESGMRFNEQTTRERMLMYGKEASNRKQEIDRQHYTIPNQRPKDKHCGKI